MFTSAKGSLLTELWGNFETTKTVKEVLSFKGKFIFKY